ncbi:hypothetical protein Tco_0729744 [Tanacetum coccineum]|uniref:Uncharacterized protein n=1 Tax=Tanacetum coccineum TaxID=301880 RepID=A0ABQ4YSV0_9ASTR
MTKESGDTSKKEVGNKGSKFHHMEIDCTLAHMFKGRRGKNINLTNEGANNIILELLGCTYRKPLSKITRQARIIRIHWGGYEDEGIRRFKDYHGDGNKDGSTAVKEKGRVEHFGITLKKEEVQASANATAPG